MTQADDELEARLADDLKHTLKLVPASQRELFVSELARYVKARESEQAQTWYVTDVLFNGEHATVLGPFTTDKDAAIARVHMERDTKNDGKTYWIENLTNPKEANEDS